MIAYRLLRSNHMRPHMKDGEPIRIAIKKGQRTANAAAWQKIARLVFLKSARAAADQFTGLLLRQPELRANAPDLLRQRQAFRGRLQAVDSSRGAEGFLVQGFDT